MWEDEVTPSPTQGDPLEYDLLVLGHYSSLQKGKVGNITGFMNVTVIAETYLRDPEQKFEYD